MAYKYSAISMKYMCKYNAGAAEADIDIINDVLKHRGNKIIIVYIIAVFV